MSAAIVQTVSTVPAGIVDTFVNVNAPVLGISFITGLAHASRRVAGRAFGVHPTRESIARVFAVISIQGVGVERRRTNTLARLNAFFICLAFVITCASFLCWRAQSIVGISTITVRTNALVRSWTINTFSSIPANLTTFCTLVYIFAGAVWLGAVALWTGAITHSAGYRDTLGTLWTRFTSGTAR